MINTYPRNFARFYDTIYHQMRDGVDNEYFQNEIRHTAGKVLEIGVGTGRLFTDALNKGSDIYGLDISEEMLNILYAKLPQDQHFRISLQNIIDFTFDFKFDLIVAPFRVIMHLLDKSDQIRAIDNVYNHLNSNGRFIFDVFIPDLNQLAEGLHDKIDFDGDYSSGQKVRRMVSTSPDLIRQIIQIKFHLEWEENHKLYKDDWELPLRFFFRYELEHLIERSKFINYRIFGDYQGNELNKASKEFIVHCQK